MRLLWPFKSINVEVKNGKSVHGTDHKLHQDHSRTGDRFKAGGVKIHLYIRRVQGEGFRVAVKHSPSWVYDQKGQNKNWRRVGFTEVRGKQWITKTISRRASASWHCIAWSPGAASVETQNAKRNISTQEWETGSTRHTGLTSNWKQWRNTASLNKVLGCW